MSTVRVLIVDDDHELADLVSLVLAPAGYECEIATTCREARELVNDRRPRVVILDHDLVDGSGPAFARELRRRHADLVLIAFTGSNVSNGDSGADFDAYVVKPASPAILRDVVATAVARAEQR